MIATILVIALLATGSALAEPAESAPPRRLLLVSLDTTRADAVGAWGGAAATPNLDRLARTGTRWREALTSCPLTLPAHASMLTGLDPPEHGLQVNGQGALPAELPTLASVLAARGWANAAFIGSRVLDRRFGLARGFEHYDDRMAAERIGIYGYAERNAADVTDAALAWLGELPTERKTFVWIHYYDPHAPYAAPGADSRAPLRARYLDEVAYVDQQLGRLLDGLPGGAGQWLIAVVGDHGEALGEHGEQTHGLFLYRGVLEVPLLVCGPGVTSGRVVTGPVSTTRLAATILKLLGMVDSPLPGAPLPFADDPPGQEREPVYSETRFPLASYGWSPLAALTDDRWHYVSAPRAELYDLESDPGETRNVVGAEHDRALRMAELVASLAARVPHHRATAVDDAEVSAALRALGYLEGGADEACDGIDPKDGPALLDAMAQSRLEIRKGRASAAVERLEPVLAKNPSNPVAWARLAEARTAAGDLPGAAAARRSAAALRTGSEFYELAVGDAELANGKVEAARAAWRRAVALDPRFAAAWERLADLNAEAGGDSAERAVLREALATGTASAVLLVRLAALAESEEADQLYEEATELLPEDPTPWLAWGRSLERRGASAEAETHYREAARRAPADPRSALALGKLLIATGEATRARPHLQRAMVLGRDTDIGAEAGVLLEALGEGGQR